MPTPAERKALIVLSGLVMLGVAVRVVGTVRGAPPPVDAASERALQHQLEAVDSVRAHGRHARRRHRADDPADGAGTRAGRRPGGPHSDSLAPHPSRLVPAVPLAGFTYEPATPIDVDRASAAQIEALPRVGPKLARRIVADRDSLGPFGSLEGLQRVRGIGPALARVLAPLVTFSLGPRPSAVDDRAPEAPAGTGHRRVRRPRAP